MWLYELLAAVPGVTSAPGTNFMVTGITADSRQVESGMLFVAVPGVDVDGHSFIPQAVAAGATAVLGERAPEKLELPASVSYIRVTNAREALGWLHAAWYGFPARQLTLVGITGTDGKTTTTNLLYAFLRAAGYEVGMLSTVSAQIGARTSTTGLHTTTPPADKVQHYLAEMVAAGATHAVVEVTSHGLAQARLAGCDFDLAVITNLTHEHLDYHGSMEAYREAKSRLFRGLLTAHRKPGQPKIAVLNTDDENSYAYLQAIPVERQLTYGLENPNADLVARDVQFTPEGLRFTLAGEWGTVALRSALVGDYNVSNILAASAAALALGVSPATVALALADFTGVPGRMERIEAAQAFTAVIDFAHTPNALQRTLKAARQIADPGGRVIVAFGCAGLRDRDKRRLMGAAAAAHADFTVVTAEDPRTEALSAIMAETARALESGGRREGVDFWQVPDRGAALLKAVSLAQPGDVVLACGKGHEQSMCFGAREYPWNDRKALCLALQGQTLATLPTAEKSINYD
ncbi:MAG TPA: UDP-N-acetylmuramoyl-L-alanyl-D-glutamate--2,6-diaminopimelate ligase [Thermoflexia bacterium]|nr:UDP-N-acetylmuramoyl-L-alanyl-D-glutamate--2,6-diaminopimelate ligase [Thermoflexia bacterium]